jgi:Arc/MetJ-type ribon-helix-helix transcriptional regulator
MKTQERSRPADRSDAQIAQDVSAWLAGRLPDAWLRTAPEVSVDRDEILISVALEAPEVTAEQAADRAAAETGRISRFREDTREERMQVAREAEHRYGRRIAWGATAGGTTSSFTTLSVPVMTRLRQPERQVLDTLVDAGVARSRSDALAWCVRLVGEHAEDWLGQLRQAMEAVEQVRATGPNL